MVIDFGAGGISIDVGKVNYDPWRRQQGYRPRRQNVDREKTKRRSPGVRWGETLGSPIAIGIENRDWKNWTRKCLRPREDRDEKLRLLSRAQDMRI
jgi:chorismate synthase